jgi:hypothetical protein
MAYSGRAAAYEKTGNLDRAVADYNMLVFSYAIELDGGDTKGDGYNELLQEASRAYRARSACLQAMGEAAAAQRDLKRAELLDAKVKKAAEKDNTLQAPNELPARVTVSNFWKEPVTLVIAGVSYTLQPGETRALPTPPGSVAYEIQAGTSKAKGTLNAGQYYNIGTPPAAKP